MGNGRRVVVVAVGLAVLLAGCAERVARTDPSVPQYPETYRAYRGEPRALEDIAVVETENRRATGFESGYIRTIDGEALPGYRDGKVSVEVEPGRRSFGLAFGRNRVLLGEKFNVAKVVVAFEAEAGGRYLIRAWKQKPKNPTGGGRTKVEVINVDTGDPVAAEVTRLKPVPPPVGAVEGE